MRNRILLTLILSIGLPLATASQQAADQPATNLKLKVNEVVLPVTVRDKHGALVTSLQAGDFTLTEDGRPQKIKGFTRETNLPYKLGLLVDTSRSLSGAMESERKAAGKFVDTMLPEKANPTPDQMFLIHFDRQVELLEDFTTARDKLHHELEEMGPSSHSEGSQGPETSRDDQDRSSRGGHNGTQLYDAIFLASDELMRSQTGRKALVVFSDGVDRGSKDTLNDAIDAADRANVVIYTIYFKGEQESNGGGFSNGGGRHGGGWPGGGGGYPGGGGGRRGGGAEVAVDGKKIMTQIASRTGGRFFEAKKKDNLDEIYTQIAEELRGQYLLTYTPDVVDKEGGYHKVALKANKDDLVVVTREGYFASLDK
jgi:VWFA-related protein